MSPDQPKDSPGPRVFVTGVGLHGGLGGAEETWQALAEGQSAVLPFRLPGVTGFPEIPAAAAAEFSLKEYLPDRKLKKYMSLSVQLAVLAAGRALEDSGLHRDSKRCADLALFISTGLIAFDLSQLVHLRSAAVTSDNRFDYALMGKEGLRRCHPLMPFKMLLNMPIGLVSIVFGIRGENFILYPGADQGGACLEAAVRGIRNGRFSRALVGGAVQGLSLMPLFTQKRMGRLADTSAAAQPYRPEHRGIAPADAGAFLMLESEDAAAERGARALAEVSAMAVHSQDGLRPDMWKQVMGAEIPDWIVSTGNHCVQDDLDEQEAAGSLWPDRSVGVVSFDGRLGYAGAAALLYASVPAVKMVAFGEAPADFPAGGFCRSGSAKPLQVLVSSTDPGGGSTAVWLSAAEGPA